MSDKSPVIEQRDGVTVISLGAEYENLDEGVLDALQRQLLPAFDAADPPLVVLDLSRTKFFGSAFLEVLLQAGNRLTPKAGGRFAISSLTTYCAEVITITHLDRVWEIFKTTDEAVAALAQN